MKPGSISCALVVLALGCGGHASKQRTGVLAFGQVVGLRYATETYSGVTDESGAFIYDVGETVTFSLGGITLGPVPAAERVTPFDLVESAPPTTEEALRAELRDSTDVTGFDRAANLALLLLSLDGDDDPSNGIDVTAWDAALVGVTLDLAAPFTEFPRNGFRRFAATHAVRRNIRPLQAITYLYDALDVRVAAHANVEVRTDDDGNGAPNRIITSAFDAAGALVRLTIDYDADGHLDEIDEMRYVALDLAETLYVFDANDDGTADRRGVMTITRDAQRRQIASTSTSDGDDDGVLDWRDTLTTTYDTAGNVHMNVTDADNQADGSIEARSTDAYVYDDDGDVTSERYEIDNPVDGVPDITQTNVSTYDAAGHELTHVFENDGDADGTPDLRSVRTYTYDAAGHVLTALFDQYDDGAWKLHRVTTYTYDARARREVERVEEDTNVDGAPDTIRTTTYTYDDAGRVRTKVVAYDTNGDGDVDRRTTDTTVYDAHGIATMTTYESDTDDDGDVDQRRRSRWTVGEGDVITELVEETDTDLAGTYTTTRIITFTFTALDDGLLNLLSSLP